MKNLITTIFLCFGLLGLKSQDVLINQNGGTPASSAALEVESTNKGVLVPRLTTTQMNAVSSPATGLLIFNSTTGGFYFYNGSAWLDLSEDNLGDHKATQNIELNNQYLSNDGGSEGITIDNIGDVSLSGNASIPSGALAIGTSTQTGQLTLFGDLQNAFTLRSSDNTLSHGIAFQNSGAAYTWNIFREDAGTNDADLVFSGGSSNATITSLNERLRINKDGEVGIGTNNPTSPLHILSSPPTNGNTGQIQIGESTSSNTMMMGRTQTYGFMQTQNSEPLSFNPLGNNVGIGTTAPGSLLHVSSETTGDAIFTLSADTDNNNESDNPGITLSQDGGTVNSFFRLEGVSNTTISSSISNSLLIGQQEAYPLQLTTNNLPRLTVLSSGNVGIGTTTPAENLVVSDSSTDAVVYIHAAAATTDAFVGYISDGSLKYYSGYDQSANAFKLSPSNISGNQFVMDNSGKIGLNTATPQTLFHINSTTDASLTTHGSFVIGDISSINIVMDNNEIIARNNAVNSTLNIQTTGGLAKFGGDIEADNIGGSAATNGYAYIGNVMIQWGTASSTIDGTESFSFPTSFGSCYSVQTTRTAGGVVDILPIVNKTSSIFQIDRNNGIDGSEPFTWFAVGSIP